jgi:hypothetical protein
LIHTLNQQRPFEVAFFPFRVVENSNALSDLLASLGPVNIVYNKETGGLNYISDSPVALRFTRIATIQGNPPLTASDFQIIA